MNKTEFERRREERSLFRQGKKKSEIEEAGERIKEEMNLPSQGKDLKIDNQSIPVDESKTESKVPKEINQPNKGGSQVKNDREVPFISLKKPKVKTEVIQYKSTDDIFDGKAKKENVFVISYDQVVFSKNSAETKFIDIESMSEDELKLNQPINFKNDKKQSRFDKVRKYFKEVDGRIKISAGNFSYDSDSATLILRSES